VAQDSITAPSTIDQRGLRERQLLLQPLAAVEAKDDQQSAGGSGGVLDLPHQVTIAPGK
jgi:hypothetical protein